MIRFIQTSDWHLGQKLKYVNGDRGGRARSQRFETIERIGELAKAEKADVIVVAGDVFDSNFVSGDHLQQARDALAKLPCPVLIIPGNHDFSDTNGALERLAPHEHGLDHVQVLTTTDPVDIGEATFFPCPLTRRHSHTDTTEHLPLKNGSQKIWVAIAHGSIHDFSNGGGAPNLIDPEKVIDKGFDYLAIGDWHDMNINHSRYAYSGAHEPAALDQTGAGNVLVVDIPGPGVQPTIRPVQVGRIRLHNEERVLEGPEDVDALDTTLNNLSERSWTMGVLRLSGSLSLGDRTRLGEMLDRQADELLYLRPHTEAVELRLTEAEMAELNAPGFIGDALEQLSQSAEPYTSDTIQLIYRYLKQVN
jgi:DNA repair exonuclease SbcCD nuclease subunit